MAPRGLEQDVVRGVDRPEGWLPMAALAYDGQSPACRATAETLRAILVDLDERLVGALGLEALDGGLGALGPWLAALAQVDEGARWGRLDPAWRVAPVLHGLQAVVVLEAAPVLEAPAALARAWRDAPSRAQGLLVVLLDAQGRFSGPALAPEVVRGWLTALGPCGPRPLRVLLAGGARDDGRPLTREALAQGVAAALATDLVLFGPGDLRPLSEGLAPASRVTLAGFGARALRYAPGRLGEGYGRRLARELLEAGPFAEVRARPESATEPPAGQAVLEALWPRGGAGQPRLLRSGARATDPGPGPVLRLADDSAGMDVGALFDGIALDGLPRRAWVGAIHDLDFVVRRGRLPRWLNQVGRRLEEQVEACRRRVTDLLARAFVARGGARHAQEWIDRIEERARLELGVVLERRPTTSLEQDLDRVERALEGLPHTPGLVLRTGALVLAQGLLLALAVVHTGGAPALGWLAPIALLLATLGAGVGLFLAGRAGAQRARDRALAHVSERAQDDVLVRLQAAFHALRDAVLGACEQARRQLAEARAVLDPERFATVAPAPPAPGPLLELPDVRSLEPHYTHVLGREAGATPALQQALARRLAARTRRLLREPGSAEPLAAAARLFGERLAALRLRTEDGLWQHVSPDGAWGSPDRQAAAVEHLLPPEGRYFVRGPAVERARLADGHRRHVVVRPADLRHVAYPGADHERVGADARLLACVSVVELGTADQAAASGAGLGGPAGPAGPGGREGA